MSWKITYRIERDATLGTDERAALEAHVASHAEGWVAARYGLELGGDGPVLARGMTTVPLDFVHADVARVLDALTALRGVIADATCIVEDDRKLIGWDPIGRYAINAGVVPSSAPAPAPPPAVDVDPVLADRIRKLVGHADAWTERRSLDVQDPEQVALAGLAVFRELPECYDVRATISNALEKIADRTPLRDAMIALWAEPAPREDWWRDAARALEPAASDPALVDAMVEIVRADVGDDERRRAAIELLAYARSAWADVLPVLVARLRRDRDRSRDDARWRERAIEALGQLGRAEALPTFVLEMAAETHVGWYPLLRAFGRACGAEALPWLRRVFPCSGAAEYTIDVLEDIPGARDWLRELAASPEPRFRALAGRYLGRRGDSELPLVAAIWKSLDVIRYEQTSSFREEAQERLGVPRGQPFEDWDVLVRRRGQEPIEVPPVGDVLDGLVADDDSRMRAVERLGRDEPDPSLLLALVLAVELDEALGRRGHRKASSPKWDVWARLVPAWRRFSDRYGYSPDMGEWIRANRGDLPPQRLSPMLERILDEGADAVAATMHDPRFLLDAAEAITIDAAERVLIAKAKATASGAGVASPAVEAAEPAVLPFDASELFGARMEPPPPRVAPVSREAPSELLDGTADGEAVALVPGTTWVDVDRSDPTLPWLTFEGAVENRSPRPLRLASLELALRDASGVLQDVARRVLRDQFWHFQTVDARVGFSQGSFDRATAVDAYLTHEVGYRARVFAADLAPYDGAPLDARVPWPYTARPIEPGYPQIAARLAVFRPRADYLRVEFVVELTQRSPLREPTETEVCVALRNRGGSVVDRSILKATLENGGPTFVHGQLNVDLPMLRTARRIEVALAGTTRRTERVGAFALRRDQPGSP